MPEQMSALGVYVLSPEMSPSRPCNFPSDCGGNTSLLHHTSIGEPPTRTLGRWPSHGCGSLAAWLSPSTGPRWFQEYVRGGRRSFLHHKAPSEYPRHKAPSACAPTVTSYAFRSCPGYAQGPDYGISVLLHSRGTTQQTRCVHSLSLGSAEVVGSPLPPLDNYPIVFQPRFDGGIAKVGFPVRWRVKARPSPSRL